MGDVDGVSPRVDPGWNGGVPGGQDPSCLSGDHVVCMNAPLNIWVNSFQQSDFEDFMLTHSHFQRLYDLKLKNIDKNVAQF